MARRRKFDMKALQERTAAAGEDLSKRDRARDEEAQREVATRSIRHIDDIQPRPGGDTRPLNPTHVASLAESIEALGLLEPLVVDRAGHLLAGGHRLLACRLLDKRKRRRTKALQDLLGLADDDQRDALETRIKALHTATTFDVTSVPVRAFDFEATDDPERALEIETSENTQRRDYTRAEIVRLYQRLVEAGYTDRRGKPKPGEKAARPVIATVIGRSLRTVRRILNERQAPPEQRQTKQAFQATTRLQRALKSFAEEVEQLEDIPSDVLKALETLHQSNLENHLETLRQKLETRLTEDS